MREQTAGGFSERCSSPTPTGHCGGGHVCPRRNEAPGTGRQQNPHPGAQMGCSWHQGGLEGAAVVPGSRPNPGRTKACKSPNLAGTGGRASQLQSGAVPSVGQQRTAPLEPAPGRGWAGAQVDAESSQLQGPANHLATHKGIGMARPVAGEFLRAEALRNGPGLFCYLGSFWPCHPWVKEVLNHNISQKARLLLLLPRSGA